MPSFRKLEPQEVRSIENKGKGVRKLIEEEYDRFLADFTVGDYGEAIPNADDNRLTVRNRLKAAAKRKGIELEFARIRGGNIRFKVVERAAPQAAVRKPAGKSVRREKMADETPPVVPSLNATAKGKPGRPKKTA
jgi:hypothetical protein